MSDNEDSQMGDDSPNGHADDMDNSGIPQDYNDTNRAFLQAFMSRGSMTFEQGQSVLAAIFTAARPEGSDAVAPASITRADFDRYVQAAHEILLPLDMDIRSARHQRTRERIWALVNVESDPATQLATAHTADEMAYVNRLLDLMFEKNNSPRMEVMAVEENECFKISRPPARGRQSNGVEADGEEGGAQSVGGDKGLKHSEIITLLANLVAEGWLEKSRAGYYSLTPRALMELKSWLVETYNDEDQGGGGGEVWQPIKFCEVCKEIVTVGQRCGDPDCLTRIHDICERAYWDTRPEKKCPRCDKEWDGKLYVGERAVTATEAYARRKRKSQTNGRRGSRREEEEEVEDGDDD